MSETNSPPAEAPEPAETPAPADTPAPEPEAKPAAEAKPEREPWFVKRIAEQQRAIGERDRLLALAERKLSETPGAQRQPEAPPDVHTLAERRAVEMVQAREFNSACDAAYNSGKAEFPDFDAAMGNFKALGGLPTPLVEAALETGEAHKVLYALAKDPDEAQRVMGLSPARMGAALAKLAAKPAPPPVSVSKAPQPVRALGGGSARSEGDPEKMSMAEFTAWRAKQRNGARA